MKRNHFQLIARPIVDWDEVKDMADQWIDLILNSQQGAQHLEDQIYGITHG